MRWSSVPEEQVGGIRNGHEARAAIAALCRQHGISAQILVRWKRTCGGLEVNEARRLKALGRIDGRIEVGLITTSSCWERLVPVPYSDSGRGRDPIVSPTMTT